MKDFLQEAKLARPQRGGHLLAASGALIFSVGLHAVGFHYFPELNINNFDRAERRSFDKFEIEDVLPEPPPAHAAEPDRPLPSAEEELRTLSQDIENFNEQIEDLLPLKDIEAAMPTPEVDLPAPPPDLPELAMQWEPRQEIMQINETLLTEEIEIPEFRAIPDLPQIDRSIDIVPPAPAPTPEDLARPLHEIPRPGNLPAEALPIDDLLGAMLNTPLPEPPMPDFIGTPDALSDAVTERPAEVTERQAVEELLGLQVFRHADVEGQVYFKMQIFRRGSAALPVLPKDVVFLQDCSESMTNFKLDQCKEGLQRAVRALGPDDRFNILGFRDNVEFCFDALTPVSPTTRARARGFIARMRARGKTDVNASLVNLLDSIHKAPDRPLIAVIVTDGRPTMGLVDSSEIIETFTRRNQGNIAVFSIGGGRRANKYLLDLVSYRNRGDAQVVRHLPSIPEALTELSTGLSRPVLYDLRYRFSGLDQAEIFPRTLTDLYLDRPLTIYGRAPRGTSKIVFQIVGEARGNKHDLVFEMDLTEGIPSDESLRTEWAEQKMYALIGEYSARRDGRTLAEMKLLSSQFRLEIPYSEDW